MSARIAQHIRSNIYGFIAIFIALSGTAYAVNGPLPGKNQVGSADIINREVKEQDLGTGAVTTDKIADNAVTGAKIAGDSVSSSKVATNSLDGEDIAEGSLGQVPSAVLGGYGRSLNENSESCDPQTTTYIDCGFTTLSLPSATRVLMVASVKAGQGSSSSASGNCRLATSSGIVPGTQTPVVAATMEHAAWTAVTGIVGPGSVDFGLECNQGGSQDILYQYLDLSAVALSPN